MDKATGGAAFPDPGRAQSAKQRTHLTETGMTLRDYFAAQALQGITSNTVFMASLTKAAADAGVDRLAGVAECAYDFADAMIAERAA